jgi:hypothetical protein
MSGAAATPMPFGELLRGYRLARGLTQEALADRPPFTDQSPAGVNRQQTSFERRTWSGDRLHACVASGTMDRSPEVR